MTDSSVVLRKTASGGEKLIRRKSTKILPPGSPWNDIEEAFLKRRSVRKYKRKQVPEHYIKRILEVARYAPSAGNTQPWSFLVVRDRDTIQEMELFVRDQLDMMAASATQAGRNENTLVSEGEEPGLHPVPYGLLSTPEGDGITVFHGAPTLIFPLIDTRGLAAQVDHGIVGTNISMAAYSLGLGSCWIGFAAYLNAGDWPQRFGVEPPFQLADAITVGFEAGDAQANYIQREAHRTTWIENGESREIY